MATITASRFSDTKTLAQQASEILLLPARDLRCFNDSEVIQALIKWLQYVQQWASECAQRIAKAQFDYRTAMAAIEAMADRVWAETPLQPYSRLAPRDATEKSLPPR